MNRPVVLITGGLSSIGRATALAYAAQHARIVISGRRDADGRAFAFELEQQGAEAAFVLADVRVEEDVRDLVDQTVSRFGRLDIAINNASTSGSLGLVCEQNGDSYIATFETNVLGTLLSLKHEVRILRAQGSGCIVNISSVCAQEGAPGAALYAASKSAIEALTRSTALEVAAAGIRVNAIARRSIEIGIRHPEEGARCARAIMFLGSEEATHVNGRVLNLEGGEADGRQVDTRPRVGGSGSGSLQSSHRRLFAVR